MRRSILFFLLGLWLWSGAALGQGALSGLARLTDDGVSLRDTRHGATLTIPMTQIVPWRVFTLDDPWRVVLDFSELDWEGTDPVALATRSEKVEAVAVGVFRPGWTRMVLELGEPMRVAEAGMQADDGAARMKLRLEETDAEAFAYYSGAPEGALFHLDAGKYQPALTTGPARAGDLVVVLDPGHGGIDPGAERAGIRESDLMLAFARELKEVLLRAGGMHVVLTRDSDVFVPLEERVAIARRAGADVFLSLHADALAQGQAHGATVYTLAEEASDEASAKLAERHDRGELLAGVDLSETDDEVAMVLMDLARVETAPRAGRLADSLVEGIYSATQSTYKTPRHQAAFSVLKAPDIPSALIELGFLSSESDRAKLSDPTWRRRAAEGIRDALLYWAVEDAATARRLRQ